MEKKLIKTPATTMENDPLRQVALKEISTSNSEHAFLVEQQLYVYDLIMGYKKEVEKPVEGENND